MENKQLTVTRRINQTIIIGSGKDEAIITLVSDGRDGKPVKIRISAPEHVPIDRGEVREKRIKKIDSICEDKIARK